VVATTVSTGSDGDRYIGGSTANAMIPATSVTGDLEVQFKVRLSDFTPAATAAIAGKNGSAGQRGWWAQFRTDGLIEYSWSNDGTALVSVVSSVAPSVVDGADIWVRVTHDIDNGATGNDVKFWTSTDGVTWTQLGTTRTTAGVTSIFDNSATPFQLLGRGGGVVADSGVRGYALRVLNGIGGPPRVDLDMDFLPLTGMTFLDFCGTTVTVATTGSRAGALGFAIFDGSLAGSGISYAGDDTRFPLLVPVTTDLAFINYGHTGGTTSGANYLPSFTSLRQRIESQAPFAHIMACIQNPQGAPRTTDQINAHADRQASIKTSMLGIGYGILDFYKSFIDNGGSLAVLLSDGVHPADPAGYAIDLSVAKAAFGPVT
jgi:hypothetical protein